MRPTLNWHDIKDSLGHHIGYEYTALIDTVADILERVPPARRPAIQDIYVDKEQGQLVIDFSNANDDAEALILEAIRAAEPYVQREIMKKTIENPCFVALQSSKLAFNEGLPIEVGLAVNDGNCTRTWSSLIRPEEDWNIEQNWDPLAQRSHGIEIKDLYQAEARQKLSESILHDSVSNNYTFVVLNKRRSEKMLELLFDDNLSTYELELISFDDLLKIQGLSEPRLARVNRYFMRANQTLRAEASAAAMAYAYKEAGEG